MYEERTSKNESAIFKTVKVTHPLLILQALDLQAPNGF
jgi:hypothetical protein